MNLGLTEVQLKHFIAVIGHKIGKQQAETAATVLEKILLARR